MSKDSCEATGSAICATLRMARAEREKAKPAMNIRESRNHASMILRTRMFMRRAPLYEQRQLRSNGKRGMR